MSNDMIGRPTKAIKYHTLEIQDVRINSYIPEPDSVISGYKEFVCSGRNIDTGKIYLERISKQNDIISPDDQEYVRAVRRKVYKHALLDLEVPYYQYHYTDIGHYDRQIQIIFKEVDKMYKHLENIKNDSNTITIRLSGELENAMSEIKSIDLMEMYHEIKQSSWLEEYKSLIDFKKEVEKCPAIAL